MLEHGRIGGIVRLPGFRSSSTSKSGGGAPAKRAGWRSLKSGEKIALSGVTAAVLGVIVSVVGLIPPFHGMAGSDDKGHASAAPRPPGTAPAVPATSADPAAPPVKIEKIDFPEHDGQSMVGRKPLAKARVAPLIKRLNHGAVGSVLRPLGNVDTESTSFAVRMEGNTSKPVRITNMHAVATCTAPLNGVLFYNPNAGEQFNPQIAFDLDQPDPIARGRGKDDGRGNPVYKGEYFVNHEYVLKLGEPATFVVSATTREHYCEFHLVMDLLVNGAPTTQKIENDGKPFTVSAGLGTRPYDGGIVYDPSRYKMTLVSPIVSPYPPRTWRLARPGMRLG
jgi:hypothetical protein